MSVTKTFTHVWRAGPHHNSWSTQFLPVHFSHRDAVIIIFHSPLHGTPHWQHSSVQPPVLVLLWAHSRSLSLWPLLEGDWLLWHKFADFNSHENRFRLIFTEWVLWMRSWTEIKRFFRVRIIRELKTTKAWLWDIITQSFWKEWTMEEQGQLKRTQMILVSNFLIKSVG